MTWLKYYQQQLKTKDFKKSTKDFREHLKKCSKVKFSIVDEENLTKDITQQTVSVSFRQTGIEITGIDFDGDNFVWRVPPVHPDAIKRYTHGWYRIKTLNPHVHVDFHLTDKLERLPDFEDDHVKYAIANKDESIRATLIPSPDFNDDSEYPDIPPEMEVRLCVNNDRFKVVGHKSIMDKWTFEEFKEKVQYYLLWRDEKN